MPETILITGANRGIGLELAKQFHRQGWRVLACCRNPQRANSLRELQRQGGLELLRLDVTEREQIEVLAERLAETPIDILFNNAGVFGPGEQDFGQADEAWWLEVFRVNSIAPLVLIEALIEQVVASSRRVVASMGSQLGSIGENTTGGWYAYRASKSAVHMVMRGLATDLRERGIISVAFHPGWVRTRMGGPEAPLEPAESAAGLFRVLDKLTPEQSGSLLNYRGETLPW